MRSNWQPRRFGAIVSIVLCLASAAVAQTDAPTLSSQVDELFSGWNRNDAPGAAVAVIRNGRIVYENAFGMADLERGVALTPHSAFEIGSISKQFTAMCILLLENDGALARDDDIRKHVPEMPVYQRPITIRHLLHHISGVRDIETLFPLAGLPYVNYYSMEEQLELITRQQALNFAPGDEYLYSNSGYLLLALIVERVSGRSLREFADERIFQPLGMRHTVFWDHPGQVVENRAIAYSPEEEGGYSIEMWNLPFAGPAGLYTTVGDLALWDANFYDNQLGGGAALIESMETPGTLENGKAISYANGLVVGTLWGLPVIRHGGAWMGYRAGLMRFPEQRLTVVLLSNAASINVGSGSVARLFLAQDIESDEAQSTPFELPETVELPVEQLARNEGTYWNEAESLLRVIELREGELNYVRAVGDASELAAVETDRFVMIGPSVRVDVEFEIEDETAHRTMTVTVDGQALLFEPVEALSERDLVPYIGTYWSEDLQRELRISVADGRLAASWTDAPAQETARFIRTDEVLLQSFVPVPWSPQDVRLQFVRDDPDQIVGLNLSCEMVRGVAFEKQPL